MSDATAASSQRPLVTLSLLIMAVGLGWLLAALGVGPGINWAWILGMGTVGILTFVVSGGVDKASIVLGPFLLVASLTSILRQAGVMSFDVEVPVLVIVFGGLMLLSQWSRIRVPIWYVPPPAIRRES
jgi:hypothetical protein